MCIGASILDWGMKRNGFKKENKVFKEINSLLGLLEKKPADTETRLRLADLYLQAGDQASAIKAYLTAAKYLSAADFHLEAISIYQKILSLDGFSLNQKSLVSLEEAETLLIRTREAYEKVFQPEPQDEETKGASDVKPRDRRERRADRDRGVTPDQDTSAPVPVGILLDEPYKEGISQMVSDEGPEEPFSDPRTPPPERSPLVGSKKASREDIEREPLESLPPPFSSPDRVLDEKRVRDPLDKGQLTSDMESFHPREDLRIDLDDIQVDDVLEAMLAAQETIASPDDSLLSETPQDQGEGGGLESSPAFQQVTPGEQSSTLNTHAPPLEMPDEEDIDLHYNLGIAYYEMDLIDKATEEFTKALEQEIKPLESRVMLAKCYFRKGLFQESARLIHQAQKLDNLARDQIDMLKGQLEEIKAKSNVSLPPPLRRPDS